MSGSSSSNNSWTLLTPEETAAETLRPLAEGTEHQDEPHAPTEELAKPTDGAEGLSVVDHSMSEEKTTKQIGETDYDGCAPDLHIPASSEVTSPYSRPEDQPVDSAQCSSEPDSFSDSYTHLSPSPDQSPASPLATETLGHLDLVRGQTDDDTELQTEQEFQQEGEESDLPQRTYLEKPQAADSTVETKVVQEETEVVQEETEVVQEETEVVQEETEVVQEETETTASEGEPEVRRRRSLLAALEKIGRTDEEEEAEEDFQLPQREEDTGFTLNKCILGAVILLGLGTIFFSESDYATRELNDSEAPGKQEWLNPDVAPPAADADTAELLNKLAKGNEHIAMLQAQLQAQNEELKVAKGQAAEGTSELLQQEEVEKENTASSSPSGQTEDSRQKQKEQVQKKDKHDKGERKEWKDAERSEWKKEKKQRKDGGKDKEWKKDKPKEHREEGKHKKQYSDEPKQWKEKEWKKEKSKRSNDGKDKNERKEWTDKSDKKSKHDQFNGDKQWRSKEEKRDLKEGKHHREWHKGNKEKQWKKGTDGHKEEGKNKYERKDWKERGEKKEKDNDWKSKNGKENGERKQWRENDWKNNKDERKWKKKDDRKQWSSNEEVWKGGDHKEKKHKEDWREDKHKHTESDHGDHKWTERKPAHSHHKPSPRQPEFWVHHKDRLQHSTRQLRPCNSLDSCAQAQGVRPVLFSEFEDILQTYLSKAQTAGVDDSQIDELRKLVTESFKNGVFVHEQMSFQDYVEDLGDILEDLVEDLGEEGDGNQDSAIEDEMEGFEREVIQKFMLSGSGEEGRVKGEWRKESGRGHG